MTKLKKYNQILLAIGGTVAVLFLNSFDIQKLWLFDMSRQVFVAIKAKENASFINFAANVAKDELILQYGEDRNKNGAFETQDEPKIYYKLEISTGELQPVLPLAMLNELQAILEGSAE